MSTLIVEVCKVDKVERHPRADRLAIAHIKGWKTCIRFDPKIKKAEFAVGDKCVFFPPDCILPPQLANDPNKVCKNSECRNYNKPVLKEAVCPFCSHATFFKDGTPGRLGVMCYCAPVKDVKGNVIGGRVKATRLRGEQSFGFIIACDDPTWEIGKDVKDVYGVAKWEPPTANGDFLPSPALFHKYTDIEHFANYPYVITDGTEIVLTEKIHGTNCRIGLIYTPDEEGKAIWTHMCGSHENRCAEFSSKKIKRNWLGWFIDSIKYGVKGQTPPKYEYGRRSVYWLPLDNDNIKLLLNHIKFMPWPEPKVSVIIFGEIYGCGIQDLQYGLQNGQKEFRVFDIAVNRKYLDFDIKQSLLSEFNIPMVPVLYRGPYKARVIEEYVSGDTTLCDTTAMEGFKGREGVVITPTVEIISEQMMLTSTNGRVIFKALNADYLDRNNPTDSH
jgi:RNA ligase (TIGR02306 family)